MAKLNVVPEGAAVQGTAGLRSPSPQEQLCGPEGDSDIVADGPGRYGSWKGPERGCLAGTSWAGGITSRAL